MARSRKYTKRRNLRKRQKTKRRGLTRRRRIKQYGGKDTPRVTFDNPNDFNEEEAILERQMRIIT